MCILSYLDNLYTRIIINYYPWHRHAYVIHHTFYQSTYNADVYELNNLKCTSLPHICSLLDVFSCYHFTFFVMSVCSYTVFYLSVSLSCLIDELAAGG